MIREASIQETIEKAPFVYRVIGPLMEHNYLCAVCRYESAVIDCNSGVLGPCWECQSKGWEIRKKIPWWRRWFT